MFNKQFLGSKVGAAALASIAAMVSFNIAVLCTQFSQPLGPTMVASERPMVELA